MKALITGISGMDGSHLADFLLEKGYEVIGMERRSSSLNRLNTSHLEGKIRFVNGDMTDQNSLTRIIKTHKPDEIYNLAAQSFVGESWNTPEHTSNVTALGVLRILESIRETDKNIKFYQASSSEMFGINASIPATETTRFYPRSPYGVSKLYGHWMTKNYRESYKLFACSGILFNHESERRGFEFVTRKISRGVANIWFNKADHIALGNLDAKRDWGYAPDYVEAMWLMLQQEQPNDYVIATGNTYSIRDFLETAFAVVGITDWLKYIKEDPRYMRPVDIDVLRGDSSFANEELGWKPKTSFAELVRKMVENDLEIVSKI